LEPIGEYGFARYFFEVWDALEESAQIEGRDPKDKLVYFRFLTLMSFHVFVREAVDTAIYKVGIGGAWDLTNFLKAPVVTGITTLSVDHVAVLDNTIEEIAWHESGIFNENCPAITVEQVPPAKRVLQQRAVCKNILLGTVRINPALSDVKTVPDADFQCQSASLAIALASVVLQKSGTVLSLTASFRWSLSKAKNEYTVWHGRCEILIHGNTTWYLDGAHTVDSLKVAGHWFAELAQDVPGILIFNQQSRPERTSLLRTLHESIQIDFGIRFNHVIFCTNVTHKETGYRKGRFARQAVHSAKELTHCYILCGP